MHLCLQDLAKITGGQLWLAAMPPRDGELAAIERIVFAPLAASWGDVFWALDHRGGEAEAAFLQGALGVVLAGPHVEPWPGRFSLRVENAEAALERLVEALADEISSGSPQILRTGNPEEIVAHSPELKVLQLCAARQADIYSHTCDLAAKRQREHRCRRRAA